jgi:hypothetical protein
MKKSKRFSVAAKNSIRLLAIFNKLKKFLPKAYRNIQIGLVLTETEDYKTYQGGYAVPCTINIGSEYLNTYPTDIALAEILAHELGHHVMGHVLIQRDREITPQEEQDADHFGMFLCELAGFHREEYITWFERFENDREKTLSKKHIQEHGTGNERLKRLKDQSKYLNSIGDFK